MIVLQTYAYKPVKAGCCHKCRQLKYFVFKSENKQERIEFDNIVATSDLKQDLYLQTCNYSSVIFYSFGDRCGWENGKNYDKFE